MDSTVEFASGVLANETLIQPGLDNVVVVSKPDAVLVPSADESQNVGKVAERLNGEGRRKTARNHAVHRPSGQYGSYLGEDDIVRIDDVYGRS